MIVKQMLKKYIVWQQFGIQVSSWHSNQVITYNTFVFMNLQQVHQFLVSVTLNFTGSADQ